MQSEIDEINSLKICIAKFEVKNAELKKKFAEIRDDNDRSWSVSGQSQLVKDL